MISDGYGQNGKVVLLGASGRLGQICRLLWPEAGDLVCHSRNQRPGFVSFDPLQDDAAMRAALRGARAVVCFSGVTPSHAERSGDALSLNTELALAAVHAAQDAGVARVFLASSAAVYGRAKGILAEDSLCEPVSPYGQAKLAMEYAALARAKDIGQHATVLRIGNVAGADAILGGWQKGMMIDDLSGGKTPSRSYIGPTTLARVIHELTSHIDLPDVINIAAPGAVEMGALLTAADLAWSPREPSEDVIEKVELSTARLEGYVTFTAQDSTPLGLIAEWRDFVQLRQGQLNDTA